MTEPITLPVSSDPLPATGRLDALFLAVARDTPMRPVERARAIAGQGLDGCRHAVRAPGGKRQILIADAAELVGLALSPGQLKENFVVSGLPLESFLPGQRLGLGPEVVVELSEQCVPCQKLEKIRPGMLKQSWGRRGQLGRVITGGEVAIGDTVKVLDVNPDAPKKPLPRLPE